MARKKLADRKIHCISGVNPFLITVPAAVPKPHAVQKLKMIKDITSICRIEAKTEKEGLKNIQANRTVDRSEYMGQPLRTFLQAQIGNEEKPFNEFDKDQRVPLTQSFKAFTVEIIQQ